MASGAKLTIVSRGELPRAEGPGGEKYPQMGYFRRDSIQGPMTPLSYGLGSWKLQGITRVGGQETWAPSLLRIHSRLCPDALPSGMLEPECTSSPQWIAGSSAFVKCARY